MKRAKNVAEAVVKTRPSLSSWSCIGPRRRTVGPLSTSKVEDIPDAPLITETCSEAGSVTAVVTNDSVHSEIEYHSSSSGLGNDDTDEDEELISVDGRITRSNVENISEGELWYQLEKELKRQENKVDVQAQEEENVLAEASESITSISSSDVTESHHFYPPGRIMHVVSVPSSDTTNLDGDSPVEERVGIYETPRKLYNKIRLSRTMINDHYMPMYKKMIELLVSELEKEAACNCVILQE